LFYSLTIDELFCFKGYQYLNFQTKILVEHDSFGQCVGMPS